MKLSATDIFWAVFIGIASAPVAWLFLAVLMGI